MGPMRIFGEEANTLDIEICFVSTSFEPVRTSQQVTITPKYLVSDTTQKYDLFFIPGGNKCLSCTEQQMCLCSEVCEPKKLTILVFAIANSRQRKPRLR